MGCEPLRVRHGIQSWQLRVPASGSLGAWLRKLDRDRLPGWPHSRPLQVLEPARGPAGTQVSAPARCAPPAQPPAAALVARSLGSGPRVTSLVPFPLPREAPELLAKLFPAPSLAVLPLGKALHVDCTCLSACPRGFSESTPRMRATARGPALPGPSPWQALPPPGSCPLSISECPRGSGTKLRAWVSKERYLNLCRFGAVKYFDKH